MRKLAAIYDRLQKILRAMVGMPDYKTYVAHACLHHPELAPMTYEEFFRDRQERRYGGGASRCC